MILEIHYFQNILVSNFLLQDDNKGSYISLIFTYNLFLSILNFLLKAEPE